MNIPPPAHFTVINLHYVTRQHKIPTPDNPLSGVIYSAPLVQTQMAPPVSTPHLQKKIYSPTPSIDLVYRCLVQGADSPWVLFVHGLNGNYSGFTEYLPRFAAAGYNVLLIDLRGHGQSTKKIAPTDYTIELLQNDIEAICQREGITELSLISHCFGSFFVLLALFRSTFPRLQRLVLIQPFFFPPEEKQPTLRSLIGAPFIRALSAIPFPLPYLSPHYHNPEIFRDRDRSLLYFFLRDLISNPVRLTQLSFQQARTHADRLHTLLAHYPALPTLLIAGDKDVFVPAGHVEYLYHQIAKQAPAEYHNVPNAGHTLPVQQPEAMSDLILDFFDRHPQRGLEIGSSVML